MNRSMICRSSILALLAFSGVAFAYDEDAQAWQESEVVFPSLPASESMMPFFVSAATSNRFLLDPASLSVGHDGVVRYVLLVETPGGASNMTYEGLRCSTREKRIYASARRDGSWSPSRNEAWEKIRDIPPNRQHAALFLDYLCPGGIIARNPDEVREALDKGGHASYKFW